MTLLIVFECIDCIDKEVYFCDKELIMLLITWLLTR